MTGKITATAAVFVAVVVGSSCVALDAKMPIHDDAIRFAIDVPLRGAKNPPTMIMYYSVGNLNGVLTVCGAYVQIGKALPGYGLDEALGAMSTSIWNKPAVSDLSYFPRYGSEAELKRAKLGCKRSGLSWNKRYSSDDLKLTMKNWVVLGK